MSSLSNVFGSGGGGGSVGITSVVTDSGTATPIGGVINLYASPNNASNAGGTVQFQAMGDTIRLQMTDGLTNVMIGGGTPLGSTFIGGLTGSSNTGIGDYAFHYLTSGTNNTGVGGSAGENLTSGSNNTVVGASAFFECRTGSYNTIIGENSGNNLLNSESSNIILGTNIPGIYGASNTLFIGDGTGTGAGQLDQAYISGINGNTVANTMMVTIDSVTDQLGTAAIPTGGSITINGDTGSVTGSTVSFKGLSTASPTISFSGSGTAMTLNATDGSGNVALGLTSNAFSGGTNVGIGTNYIALGNDVAIGTQASGGGFCVAVGYAAGCNGITESVAIGADSTCANGTSGIAIGYSALVQSGNAIAIGASASANYSGSIIIGNGMTDGPIASVGTVIGGIQGAAVTGAAVLVSSDNQLGVTVSSRKFKDNIRDMDNYSSAILSLRPTIFNYKSSTETTGGLIAEEVAEIMPDLVVYDKQGEPQTVKYHELPAMLLNELQKALARIAVLEAKLGD